MTILGMSLKIENRKTLIRWSVWTVCALLFLVAFLRVIFFESRYYSEKEGSERAVAEEVVEGAAFEEEELVETKPTESEVREYTVASDRPRYLSIDRLGIKKARILAMGVTTTGELDTPLNIFDVGWYTGSDKPGAGGTMIIDGHNGGPNVVGVFKYLPSLVDGDVVTVERGDGVIFNYRVVENKTVLLSEADEYMATAAKSPEPGKESLTLITCTGDWSQQRRTYLSRQFTRALLIED